MGTNEGIWDLNVASGASSTAPRPAAPPRGAPVPAVGWCCPLPGLPSPCHGSAGCTLRSPALLLARQEAALAAPVVLCILSRPDVGTDKNTLHRTQPLGSCAPRASPRQVGFRKLALCAAPAPPSRSLLCAIGTKPHSPARGRCHPAHRAGTVSRTRPPEGLAGAARWPEAPREHLG